MNTGVKQEIILFLILQFYIRNAIGMFSVALISLFGQFNLMHLKNLVIG